MLANYKNTVYSNICCCCAQLQTTAWTVTHQTPLSMAFSRQEHWSGLAFPTPGNLPDPGVKPMSSVLTGRFLPLVHLGSSPLPHKNKSPSFHFLHSLRGKNMGSKALNKYWLKLLFCCLPAVLLFSCKVVLNFL